MEPMLENVFGVADNIVLSYVERPSINGEFVRALKDKKHIIVYGASKQGKSSLIARHLPADQFISIGSGENTTIIDIYTSIARQENVRIITSVEYGTGKKTSVTAQISILLKLPFLGGAKTQIGGSTQASDTNKENYTVFEYNLQLAQDVCELLKKIGCTKTIVVENFHYLKDEVQKRLAIDLRTFKDKGIRFIVLGIWRERNRLAQYNGDLLDRMKEIPVEPWEKDDMIAVLNKGCGELNIEFEAELIQNLLDVSFDSIGVFQEMCKEICLASGVTEAQQVHKVIKNHASFKIAIDKKVKDYGERHISALRSFVKKHSKDKSPHPNMAYYLARSIAESSFNEILHGLPRKHIEDRIKSFYHDLDKLRESDIRYLLHSVVAYQQSRGIYPPLFDYDQTSRVLKIIDSTLFFYIKHAKAKVLEEIKDASII